MYKRQDELDLGAAANPDPGIVGHDEFRFTSGVGIEGILQAEGGDEGQAVIGLQAGADREGGGGEAGQGLGGVRQGRIGLAELALAPELHAGLVAHLDHLAKRRLKGGGDPGFYKSVMCVPDVKPIYEALKEFKLNDIHIEITNLVVPKTGDSMNRISKMAAWIRDYLGKDTPFHLLRFHPEYKMTTTPATSVQDMEHAYMTAKNQGLNYVYIGNVTGHPAENTYCPNCDTALIKRYSFEITQWHLTDEMRCSV
mgnify:CR=1 FL=1